MKKLLTVMAAMLLIGSVSLVPASALGVKTEDTQVTDDWEQIEYISGDMNGDEEVNIKDIVRLKRYLVDKTVWLNIAVADLEEDSLIDALDLASLAKLLLSK